MAWSLENGVEEIPTLSARYWNCKWLVDVDKSLYTSDGATLNLSPNIGYVYLEIEMYGWDEYTFLLVQRDDMFEDWTRDLTGNVPKLYKMETAQKYLMPPQYDNWIEF